MKIGIFYNYIISNLHGDKDLLSENETVKTVNKMEKILKKNHTVISMQISPQMISDISMANFDLAINLCESIDENPEGESLFASFLELIKLPYTGSGPNALSMCLNKVQIKELFLKNNIPTPKFHIFSNLEEIVNFDLPFPVIVKPSKQDASIGITHESVVNDLIHLEKQVQLLLEKYNQPIIVEEYIDGREINVALFGNGEKMRVLPISEIIFDYKPGIPKIIDYDCKWVEDSYAYKHTSGICPAPLNELMEEKLGEIAKHVFNLTKCRDYARVDFRIRKNEIYVLEINPNPCISRDSGFFRSISATGVNYSTFINQLLKITLERYSIPYEWSNNKIFDTIDSNLLFSSKNLLFYQISQTDLSYLEKWFNDPELGKFMVDPEEKFSFQELEEYYILHDNPLLNQQDRESFLFSQRYNRHLSLKKDQIALIVTNRSDYHPIGYCALYEIASWNQSAEISYLIGEKEYQGKGLAKEIVTALTNFGINTMGLIRIEAQTSVENIASIKTLERSGYRQIGRRHKSHFLKGKRSDDYIYEYIVERVLIKD